MFFSFDTYNILSSLILSFAVQAVFFAFAASLKTDKVTDFSYSLSFALISVILLVVNQSFAPLQILAVSLVVIWAVRLGSYLLSRIIKIGKDARFDDKRDNFPEFLKFWILQALAVWLVLFPITVLLSVKLSAPIGIVAVLGALLWLFGFLVEAIADRQKRSFRDRAENKGRWIDSGLWRYSRHPNYLGEVIQWWGLFAAAMSALPLSLAYVVLGPIVITLLILFLSGVPILEKTAEEKYGANPEYQAYKKRTSLFLLLPPRKGQD